MLGLSCDDEVVDDWAVRFKAMTGLLRSDRPEDVTLLARWLGERRSVGPLAPAEERLLRRAEARLEASPVHERRLGVAFSGSTWRQPVPPTSTATRARVVERVVDLIEGRGDGRLRVAVDGFTASGKTSFGHEVACSLAQRGRQALRASLDDFKRPWNEAHLYDRTSGEGYYHNAFDLQATRRLLLDPSGPTGTGVVALCGIDPLTQIDHSHVKTLMVSNGILVVDGTFACRPELDVYWDLRVWLDVDAELSVRRGTERDAEMDGGPAAAEKLHRDRYLAAELLYLDEVDPCSFVEVVIDNTDLTRPIVIRQTA